MTLKKFSPVSENKIKKSLGFDQPRTLASWVLAYFFRGILGFACLNVHVLFTYINNITLASCFFFSHHSRYPDTTVHHGTLFDFTTKIHRSPWDLNQICLGTPLRYLISKILVYGLYMPSITNPPTTQIGDPNPTWIMVARSSPSLRSGGSISGALPEMGKLYDSTTTPR